MPLMVTRPRELSASALLSTDMSQDSLSTRRFYSARRIATGDTYARPLYAEYDGVRDAPPWLGKTQISCGVVVPNTLVLR